MIKTAYLRVYLPDEVVVDEESAPDGVERIIGGFGLLSEPGDGGWTTVWEGRTYRCPRYLKLRVLEGTLAFANAFRSAIGGIVPEPVVKRADQELQSYHRENPAARSHVLTSPWHVPARWFVAFAPDEADVYETAGSRRLRFRTYARLATARVAAAAEALQSVGMAPPIVDEIDSLRAWLAGFDEEALVELDYDNVSDLFDPDDLVFDDSVEQMALSVERLQAGDLLGAGEHYGRVVARWAGAFALTFSS